MVISLPTIFAMTIQNQEKRSESTRSIVAKSNTPEDDFAISAAKTSETRKTPHNPKEIVFRIRFFDVFLKMLNWEFRMKIILGEAFFNEIVLS